mmetsp:Transcript_68044/g.149379  ORF Transcript_68044/g.149379 Transcript_68044/m.149379 type:complete len:595 (-) Transcript_68044:191-1975(-)
MPQAQQVACKTCGAAPLPDALFCHLCGQERLSEAANTAESVVEYAEVLEVLRTARYPAWLEVKWSLTEAEQAAQASPEAEAIVSGQASVSCSSARDAEALVEKLSSSLRGAGPRLPRFSDQGATPSKQGLLSSPSPSAPLRMPQVKAEAESGLQSLRGSPRSPVSSAHESGERRRSSSPNVLSSLRCSTASQTGGSTSLFAKSLAPGRPCVKRWSDEAAAEPRLAERARAQTSLRAESFGAALARARRWGSDRLSCSSRSSAGGSGSHSMLSRGYLDRMRGMGARQSSAPSRASRDVAVQAQSCVSTMSSLGLDTAASMADTLPASGKAGIRSPRTPNLTLPQMGAVAMAESTDSATAKVERQRVEVRKPREDVQVHSPGFTRSPQSPQMCLASPRVDLQSNSRGARHKDPVDLARAFAHGHLNGANPRNEASKVGPRIETRLVTSVDTEKAMAMEAMERVETETKAVRAVSAVSVVSEDVASRLHHSEPVVRQAAAAALGALGEVAAEHVRQLASLIEDVDSGVRRAAAIALGNLGQRAVGHADALLAASQLDDDDDVRFHAAVALGMLGATSKVARCRSNCRSRQHVPTVLA